MNSHEYFREKYDREIEMHKFSKIEPEKVSDKEILKMTIGLIVAAPFIYWGTICLMGMVYAMTGVR